jgi:signal transduction histidine kinase/CheY-like chemotaxis protein
MPRVLVIDDQRIPRLTLAATLTEAGYEVDAAENGVQGIELARTRAPDVVILDVYMPGMDGFAVVERLKADPITAPTPVIFLTAESPTDALIVRGLDLGAYDFLSKGCSKAELLARVGVMARIKRGNDELSAIARISDALIRSLDPDALVGVFVEHAREVFRADAVLFMYAADEGEARACAGAGIEASDPLCTEFGRRVLDWMEAQRETATVLPLDEMRGPAGALIRREGFRSSVAVRLDWPAKPPTLVAVLSKRGNGFRRESDAPLLELIARQASIALDNAMLHSRTRAQARQLEQQAERLARAVEERSRFFASMSHELRTPVNAVLGYSQLLADGLYGELSQEQIGVIGKVTRSTKHLLELINDILDISKIEAGKLEVFPERFDLDALLRDTLTSVELQAREKGLDLVVETPDAVEVNTDPARLRQIVLNLLSNAIKFTQDGWVRVRVEMLAEPADGDPGGMREFVAIRVTDTGPGISTEDQERIFNEFEQAEGGVAHGGTGLGLAISRRLSDLLGGRLSLRSTPGEGSEFTLHLPLERAPAESGT